MYTDIVEMREFYDTPSGQVVRRIFSQRLATIWPQLQCEKIAVLGYGVPVLRPLFGPTLSFMAMMPAEQGVVYWPREGPNISCLTELHDLPLPDESVDRVLMMHGLEGATNPHDVLREVWRILKPQGRFLAIVSNRRGLWAHNDKTPFGHGQPYSLQQIKRALSDAGFLVERYWHALYMPPTNSQIALRIADRLESVGEKIFPGFGGIIMVEVGKQLYAPIRTKTQNLRGRLVFPLPVPLTPRPAMQKAQNC